MITKPHENKLVGISTTWLNQSLIGDATVAHLHLWRISFPDNTHQFVLCDGDGLDVQPLMAVARALGQRQITQLEYRKQIGSYEPAGTPIFHGVSAHDFVNSGKVLVVGCAELRDRVNAVSKSGPLWSAEDAPAVEPSSTSM
jgi:hypothetical protein